MSFVITGASGQLGRRVVEEALQRVDPSELILVTRDPDSLAELAKGASVRYGDFTDPSSLRSAFAGGERLLLISTDAIGERVPHHRAAIEAVKEAGIGHLSYTSLPRPEDGNPAVVAADHRATEEIVRSSGLPWTFLRNNLYADMQAEEMAGAIASGQLVTSAGEGRIAYVSRRDCAAAAAAVLVGGAEHDGKAYDITGPELLDAAGRAAIFSELGGRPVEVVQVDDETYASGFAAATGLPLEVGQLLASFGRAAREGYLDVLSPSVRELSGHEPRSLREVLAGVSPTVSI